MSPINITLKPMCVGTLSILFIIKIMANSDIFITHRTQVKSEHRFSDQDEIQ